MCEIKGPNCQFTDTLSFTYISIRELIRYPSNFYFTMICGDSYLQVFESFAYICNENKNNQVSTKLNVSTVVVYIKLLNFLKHLTHPSILFLEPYTSVAQRTLANNKRACGRTKPSSQCRSDRARAHRTSYREPLAPANIYPI